MLDKRNKDIRDADKPPRIAARPHENIFRRGSKMTDDCTIPFLLEDRDRLLEEIEKRDIRISELERAISLRDQLITIEEGER